MVMLTCSYKGRNISICSKSITTQERLDDESFIKSLWNTIKTASPIIIEQAIKESSTIGGSIMLSSLGSDALAASSFIFTIHNAAIYPFTGNMFAVNVLTSQQYGLYLNSGDKKELAKIGIIYQQGKFIGTIFSVIPVIIFMSVEPMLLLFKQDKKIARMVGSYCHIYSIDVLIFFWLNCTQQLANGINQQFATSMFSLITAPLFFGTGYLLIFGKFGFPKMGVAGLGVAFIIKDFTTLVITDLYFILRKKFQPYHLLSINCFNNEFKKICKEHFQIFKEICGLGFPIIPQIASDLFGVVYVSILAGAIGQKDLETQNVILQVTFGILVFALPFQYANSALIARYYGAYKHHLLTRYNNIAVAFTNIIVCVPFIVSLFIPEIFAKPFFDINDPHNSDILVQLKTSLPLALSALIIDVAGLVDIGACRGSATDLWDTFFPMVICITTGWVLGAPLEYVLGFSAGLGFNGVLLGRCASLIARKVGLSVRWLVKRYNISNQQNESPSKPKNSWTSSVYSFFCKKTNKVQDIEMQSTVQMSFGNTDKIAKKSLTKF